MDASTISEPMRRVLDALLAGEPVPPEAQARLTDAERAEVASLARTAHLTKLTLAKPEPTAEMEAASLARAHAAFAQRRAGGATGAGDSVGAHDEAAAPLGGLLARITGIFQKRKGQK